MNVFAARREPERSRLSPIKVRAFILFALTFLPASVILYLALSLTRATRTADRGYDLVNKRC